MEIWPCNDYVRRSEMAQVTLRLVLVLLNLAKSNFQTKIEPKSQRAELSRQTRPGSVLQCTWR